MKPIGVLNIHTSHRQPAHLDRRADIGGASSTNYQATTRRTSQARLPSTITLAGQIGKFVLATRRGRTFVVLTHLGHGGVLAKC